jgi:hypothetical protein
LWAFSGAAYPGGSYRTKKQEIRRLGEFSSGRWLTAGCYNLNLPPVAGGFETALVRDEPLMT